MVATGSWDRDDMPGIWPANSNFLCCDASSVPYWRDAWGDGAMYNTVCEAREKQQGDAEEAMGVLGAQCCSGQETVFSL